jgi:acyl-CoA thioesterase
MLCTSQTVVWNQTSYQLIMELNKSIEESKYYFRHYFMENAMNSYKKAWIRTYQERENSISFHEFMM